MRIVIKYIYIMSVTKCHELKHKYKITQQYYITYSKICQIREVIDMRLWHYKLLPVLPDKMLIAEWRECIAIKRQWEKGTLKHRLVSYVKNYDKQYFINYMGRVTGEMIKRSVKYNVNYVYEILIFCLEDKDSEPISILNDNYTEHNDRYLKQCLYNLQEKFDRRIITKEEWSKIVDKFGGYL